MDCRIFKDMWSAGDISFPIDFFKEKVSVYLKV